MADVKETQSKARGWSPADVPPPVLAVFRGIGQVFFQECALSGALFTLGIALSSPLIALGGVLGSAIGYYTAKLLKFDGTEILAGIYGFNSALVGMATFFFFRPGATSLVLLAVGCVVAALATRLMRGRVPFPTYTTPFILTTWVIFFAGRALGVAPSDPSAGPLLPAMDLGFYAESTVHGVGQVMFQASLWTGLFFLAGIAVSDWRHASWVLIGAIGGMLLASYHVTAGANSIDPERLIPRGQFDNIRLGLYGYNSTLAAVALFLWRRSLIPPVLGVVISVPITEYFPMLGLPALTAPFVLSVWLVIALGWAERRFLGPAVPSTP